MKVSGNALCQRAGLLIYHQITERQHHDNPISPTRAYFADDVRCIISHHVITCPNPTLQMHKHLAGP
jgi:hypothetical protein